jgi:hypothetical protein
MLNTASHLIAAYATRRRGGWATPAVWPG